MFIWKRSTLAASNNTLAFWQCPYRKNRNGRNYGQLYLKKRLGWLGSKNNETTFILHSLDVILIHFRVAHLKWNRYLNCYRTQTHSTYAHNDQLSTAECWVMYNVPLTVNGRHKVLKKSDDIAPAHPTRPTFIFQITTI